jgi:hypothetical protein
MILSNGLLSASQINSLYTFDNLLNASQIKGNFTKNLIGGSLGNEDLLFFPILIQPLIDSFKTRVANDGGTFEAESNLLSILNLVNITIGLSKVNMLLTPNAFKTGKAYNVIGYTDFAVLRNTSATRRNSSGLIIQEGSNITRLDYQVNGVPMLLVEAQRTNLNNNSNNFTTGDYLKSNLSVVAETSISPLSTGLSNKIIENTVNSSRGTYKQINITQNLTTTISGIYKTNGRNIRLLCISVSFNDAFFVTVNLTNGTIIDSGAQGTATLSGFTVKDIGNGWYSISVTGIIPSVSAVLHASYLFASTISYQGDGSSGVYAVAKQLEQATSATSTIFTNGSGVTRNQDVITVIPPTGTIKITTAFEDNTTQTLTTIPTTFTIPTGRIKYVVFEKPLNQIETYISNLKSRVAADGGTFEAEQNLRNILTELDTRSGLLLNYPGAAVAYSLINLDSSITNVIRIRRSSDNSESNFTALQITDGTLLTFCGSGNGFVTTWYDQSGNNANVTQTTAALQPQLVFNSVINLQNGRPAIAFNGTTTFLSFSGEVLNKSSFVAFAVVKNNKASGQGRVFDQSLNNGGAMFTNSNNNSNTVFGLTSVGAVEVSYTPINTSYNLQTGQILSGNSRIRRNGVNLVTNTTTFTMSGNTGLSFIIGENSPPNAGANQAFGGNMQEIIIYTTDNDANIIGIETEINNFYNIY